MTIAIKISNISKIFKDSYNKKDIQVLQNFTLEVEKGSFIVLHGPNGCGKTTIIHILAGIEKYDPGRISIFGNSLEKAKIGVVFQIYSTTLFPWLKVVDNICFVLKDKNISKQRRREKAKSFIEHIGFAEILDCTDNYPYQLSGGQQQMVSILRALISEPPLVFFDEPFCALDDYHKEKALIRVQQFCKEKKITCLFAIHDLDEAILIADELIVLNSNPMRIKEIVNVKLERPRISKLLKNNDFFDLKRMVLEIIEREG